jgi:hypothetical protein
MPTTNRNRKIEMKKNAKAISNLDQQKYNIKV